MGYYSGRDTAIWLNSQREWEERGFSKKKFTARYAGAIRRSFVVLSIVMCVIAAIQVLVGKDWAAAGVWMIITSPLLLMLPTVLSYRCEVDEVRLRESCIVLFIPRRKEILWKDVHARKVRRDRNDRTVSIKLYDEKGRKVLSIGHDIAGIGPIARMAKEKGIPKRK